MTIFIQVVAVVFLIAFVSIAGYALMQGFLQAQVEIARRRRLAGLTQRQRDKTPEECADVAATGPYHAPLHMCAIYCNHGSLYVCMSDDTFWLYDSLAPQPQWKQIPKIPALCPTK